MDNSNFTSKSSFFQKEELNLTINNQSLNVSLENNISVDALINKLRNDQLSLVLSDYGGFEKVGPLGFSLPSNDSYMKTNYGDIVLYNSNQIVIFYGSNAWEYTKIGHIDDVSQQELTDLLGKGNINVTFSLK